MITSEFIRYSINKRGKTKRTIREIVKIRNKQDLDSTLHSILMTNAFTPDRSMLVEQLRFVL